VKKTRDRSFADVVSIDAIRTGLTRHHPHLRCVDIHRSPSAYATSYALENITVTLDDGSVLPLILKHLNPARMTERARRAKPDFLIDPRREIAVYEKILMPRAAGATVYGVGDADAGDLWLLLQKVEGAELYQVGDLDAWITAATWLAEFHSSCQSSAQATNSAYLLHHTADFYRIWLERAVRFFRDDLPPSQAGGQGLEWIVSRFERVIDRLRAWPMTVIHGDYYASNVLAHQIGSRWRVCPIDWEMAAIGPGILDLAAITSGGWSRAARHEIIDGYVRARGPGAASLSETIEAVDHAQIYLAVQWLGWFGRRRPPAEHARDWLSAAIERARQLGL
jgi:aminoglycoside phosphotransferase (APT) family kinase protein